MRIGSHRRPCGAAGPLPTRAARPGRAEVPAVLCAALALLAPASRVQAVPLSAVPVWSSAEGHATRAVAVGDVDGDGDLDLVCGNEYAANMLYLNEAGGLDPEPAWSSAPANPTRSVALGDIDGDGDLDLVCGNFAGANTLYLNLGGTFSTTPDWTSEPAGYTLGVALGDVDGDGRLDLACANFDQGNTLYPGQGGTLSRTPTWTSSPANATSDLVIGDLDGDGDLDLACANVDQPNTLYRNDGGVLATVPDWSSGQANTTAAVALGDMDGDGDLDLVCGNYNQGHALYFNAAGSLADLPGWSAGAADSCLALALGDLDGDGDLDLVSGNDFRANTAYANEAGTLTVAPVWTSILENPTHGVALGDLDGDGDLDLVCGNLPGADNLYRNERAFFPVEPAWQSIAADATRCVELGDVDGDGDLDLVFGNAGGANRMYRNEGDSVTTVPVWSSDPLHTTRGLALGDVDGDGLLDLACGNQGQPDNLYAGDGSSFATVPVWSSGPASRTSDIALGDMDGDGDLDLVCGNQDQSDTVYRNGGGGLEADPSWSSAAAAKTNAVALGDIDGDGDLDLVCGHGLESNQLYRNDGGQLATDPAWTSGPANYTTAIALGDVDGDGDLDLVCGNYDQANTLYLNEGGSFARNPTWTSGPSIGTYAVALADVDGDGDLDLVCGNDNQDNVLYLNRDGALSVTPDWSGATESATYGLALGDLDGDGDLDQVVANGGRANTIFHGMRNPVFAGDPLAPRDQLPNNSAFLRTVTVQEEGINRYRVTALAVDVESDPVWVVADYQYAGVPVWHPADLSPAPVRAGPLASSPGGTPHRFDWNVANLAVDPRRVTLRLRLVSPPARTGRIRHVASYQKAVGPLDVHRPQVATSPGILDFGTVTLGDTSSVVLQIANTGSELLTVSGLDLPSAEMRCGTTTPFAIQPSRERLLAVDLAPRQELLLSGSITVVSDDPERPQVAIPVQAEILELALATQVMSEAEVAPLGEALTLMVIPAADVVVERGAIFHRSAGTEQAFATVELGRQGSIFVGTIPGEAVTEGGIEFYVEIENSGVLATDPPGAPLDSLFTRPVASPVAIATAAIPNSGTGFLAGQAVAVDVSLPQGAGFEAGILHYRAGGDPDYRSADLEYSAPLLLGSIPADRVGPRGLEYWVEVSTPTLPQPLTDPPLTPAAAPRTIEITIVDLQEGAPSPGNVYRMVSIPLRFGEDFEGTLEDLLASQPEFGPYEPAAWRAYRYLPGTGGYVELGAEEDGGRFRPAPGRAYWLICRKRHRITTAPIAGFSTPTAGPFAVALQPGWNQVGNPFAFPVAWDSVRIDGLLPGEAIGSLIEPPLTWSPDGEYRPGMTILEPFGGFWVRNLTASPVLLQVPPREATADTSGKAVPGADRWRIVIRAECAGSRDRDNVVGVAGDAADGWDRHDRSEPPPSPGPGLSLYFPHEDWDRHPGRYTQDIRPAGDGEGDPGAPLLPDAPGGGWVWAFDLAGHPAAATAGARTILGFEGIASLPPSLSMLLIDRDLERVTDLAQQASYGFLLTGQPPVADAAEARFRLVIGTEAFTRGQAAHACRPPARTALHACRPNPFNPATVIRFDVSRAGTASLRLYDLGGALVRTLHAGPVAPGGYEYEWRGRDDRGRRVASGIYVSLLETSWGFREGRKLVLVK